MKTEIIVGSRRLFVSLLCVCVRALIGVISPNVNIGMIASTIVSQTSLLAAGL